MTDEASTTTSAAAKERKKGEKASDRTYLASDGTEAESPLGCAGVSYKSNVEGWTKTFMFDQLKEEELKGFAAFGLLTLVGNQTNRVRNGQVKDDGPQTEEAAVDSWFENIQSGNWVTAGGEVEAGAALLAEAHLRILQADGVIEHNGVPVDLDYVKERHKAKTKDERAAMRKDLRFKAEMDKIKAEKSAAKLAEGGKTASTISL